MLYRAEIDGLRAIAIISVLLYHADTVFFDISLFRNGYLGVDIFFVISGYLISRLLINQLNNKSFSLLSFFKRRVKRIVPMLTLVVVISFPFAWARFLLSDLVIFSQSALSALAFVSNIFFYITETTYDFNSASIKPLLHTWSLGVEEQFYIVAPVFLLILWRTQIRKTFAVSIYLVIILLSISFADFMGRENAEFNFFLLFSRIWELMIGSLIAYIEVNYPTHKHSSLSNILSTLGLTSIIGSLLFFPAEITHPGYNTLIPVLGVGLVIAFASNNNFAGRLLSLKPFTMIGLISYSAYLWHYPIMIFFQFGNYTNEGYTKLGLLVPTLLLAVISYYYVEEPLRRKDKILGLDTLTLLTASTITVVLLLLFTLSDSFRFVWNRFAPNHLVLVESTLKRTDWNFIDNGECLFTYTASDYEGSIHDLNEFEGRVEKCSKITGDGVFVIGDSHGLNLFESIARSDEFDKVIGMNNGGGRLHEQYVEFLNFFESRIAPKLDYSDVIIYHQAGGYFVKDNLTGEFHSERLYNDDTNYSLDLKNFNLVKESLNRMATKTEAKVFWIGPYVDSGIQVQTLIEAAKRSSKINDSDITIKPHIVKYFSEVDALLEKESENQLYTYVPFRVIHQQETFGLVVLKDGTTCFQFRDDDHFSNCGEVYISEKLMFSKLF